MNLAEFITKYTDEYINFDTIYGPQCMDLYRQYVKEVLEFPQSELVAGAADVWTNYPEEYYDRITNGPYNFPIHGDVVIWSRAYGPDGHIAVAVEADSMKLVCFSQNDPTNTPALEKTYTYNNILGWLHPKKLGSTMDDRVLGTDISLWNDNNSTSQTVDFKKMYDAGARFTFIKASQATFTDQDFVVNWKNAKEAGMLRGAYHFLTWNVDASKQAAYFVDLLNSDKGELPPVVDFEWWSQTPSNALSILKTFVEKVKQYYPKQIIYTAPGFWNQYGSSDNYWSQYDLWVAHWRVTIPLVPKPWNTYTFWQYTDKGDGAKYGAESPNVDINYFNGTLDDLYVYAGLKRVLSLEEKVNILWEAHPELHPKD